MNKAEEFHQKVLKEIETYSHREHKELFDLADKEHDEYYDEILGMGIKHKKESPYYKYLSCVVKIIKPEIVIEIGGDLGASTLCMYSELPKNGTIYTCDIRNCYWWIPEKLITTAKIRKVIGDSLTVRWPSQLDLSEVKVWLIDGDHDGEHVRREIYRYRKYWQIGTIVMFDDIRYYKKVFNTPDFDKCSDDKIHGGGFGIYVI